MNSNRTTFSDLDAHCQGLAAEQRVSCQALVQWTRIRKGRNMPALQDVDFLDRAELKDHLFLVIPGNGGGRFLIQHSGDLIRRLYGGDPQGRPLAETLPSLLAERAADCCNEALLSRQPMLAAATVLLEDDREMKYRLLVMPLSDVPGVVNHLVGSLSLRVVVSGMEDSEEISN